MKTVSFEKDFEEEKMGSEVIAHLTLIETQQRLHKLIQTQQKTNLYLEESESVVFFFGRDKSFICNLEDSEIDVMFEKNSS